jgi:hypothetical protein
MHIVLLGDSVFDNRAYVGSDPDVRTQLQNALSPDDRVTLIAIDGSVIESIFAQLKKLPADATHLVIAVGGNNLLSQMHLLAEPTGSAGDAFEKITRVMTVFRQTYHHMLETVLDRRLPTLLCTMYNPRFPDPLFRQVTMTALGVFNDVIVQEAALTGLPVIDLRLVCTEEGDFANPIEPSAKGGEKITAAIRRVIANHNFNGSQAVIYR